MKKNIFILGILMAICIGLGGINHFSAQIGNLYFNNYNSTNTNNGITSDQAKSIAFDNDGNVAYTAQASNGKQGNGLTIGIKKKDGTFAFKNYSKAEGNHPFYSDNGQGVAFDNDGNVAYVSNNTASTIAAAIVFGIKQSDGSYQFTNFSITTNGAQMSDKGVGIAINSKGDIAYATSNAGIFIGLKDTTGIYSFKQYKKGEHYIESISIDENGDIAYSTKDPGISSYTDGGLNVGRKNKDTGAYTFSNYKPAFEQQPWSYSCILSKNGESVAYTVQLKTNGGKDGELGIGKLQGDGTYSKFKYYGKLEDGANGISTSAGRAVTFDSNDNIGYATIDGGLSIGKRNEDDSYSFKQYNTSNTTGITNNYGSSVAFDNNGNVGYASIGGSLSISYLTIDIDPNTIFYKKRSDGNYNISALTLNFNSLLGDYFLNDQYVKIAITDSSQKLNFYAAYFTKDNKKPTDSISYEQSKVVPYPSEFSSTLKDISGASGFEVNENITITISIWSGANHSTVLDTYNVLNTYNVIVTDGNSSNLALELGLGLGIGIPIVLMSGAEVFYYYFKKRKKG